MTDYLIYGVDGMSKPVVDMMNADDELENIQKLQERDETVHGDWKAYVSPGSQMDVPRTGPMWNSIYTGLKPEEHGYTLDGWKQGESKFHQTYTVWDKLSEEGVELGLFDMPMTYRAKEINGWMMSGFVATTIKPLFDNMLYPSDLIEDSSFIENTPTWIAQAKFGGIAPGVSDNGNSRVAMEGHEELYEDMKEAEHNKVDKLEEIVEERGKPDIMAYGTTFADKMGHAASINPINEMTRKTYKEVDEVLGRLIDIFEPEHILVISDHGFSGFSHDLRGFYLNTAGEEFEEVFDFTPFILNEYDIEYEPEKYGVDGELGVDLTEHEKEDARSALAEMGYDVS